MLRPRLRVRELMGAGRHIIRLLLRMLFLFHRFICIAMEFIS